MSPTAIALSIVAVGAAVALVLLLASARSGSPRAADIAPAKRPAASDEELEGPHLERLMAAGVVLTLFFAIFLPAYWLREPTRAQGKAEGLLARDYSRGEELFTANCAECHGAAGEGGSAASPYGGDPWPAPNLTTIAARYEDSRINPDIRDYIVQTLKRGRPGTPMAAWGAAFQGPLTDFQIDALTDWILLNQQPDATEATGAVNLDGESLTGEELYQQNCARCHGTELQGIVGPSLIGVTERHSNETIRGILANGISILGGGMSMPPWQEGYMYPDARYNDEALDLIVAYLAESQPDEIPEWALEYQTPNIGEAVETAPDPGSEELEDDEAES